MTARSKRREVQKNIAKKLAAHPCGDCGVCCTVMAVPELGKPALLPCTRLRVGTPGQGACGRYKERPGTCAGFECLWRLGAVGGASARPDRLGVFFTVENTHASGVQLIVARETRLGALDDSMKLLHELAGRGHVLYLIDNVAGVERCRMMGPEDRVRMVQEAARRKLPLVSQ